MRKIIKAEVVPWEVAEAEDQEHLFGVIYTTIEGQEEGGPIGTKAEAVVQQILDQKVVAFDTALKRADG